MTFVYEIVKFESGMYAARKREWPDSKWEYLGVTSRHTWDDFAYIKQYCLCKSIKEAKDLAIKDYKDEHIIDIFPFDPSNT